MRTSILFSCALLVASAGLLAANEPPPKSEPPKSTPFVGRIKSSKTPWQVKCDESKGYGKEKRTTCVGHVEAWRDDLRITCEAFEMFHDDKWGVKKMTCSKNVVLKSKDGYTHSEKAEYDPNIEQLILTGAPQLFQGPNQIRGDVIVYEMREERFVVKKIRAVIEDTQRAAALPQSIATPKSTPTPEAPRKDSKP